MVKTIMNDNVLNKIISVLNYLIIALLLLTSIYLFQSNTRLKKQLMGVVAETNTTTKTDTIWRTVHHTDTVPRETIKEKVIERLDTIYIDPILPDDTTTAAVGVPLQLVRRTYEGTTKDSTSQARWRAEIKGYDLNGYPRLERMDIDVTTPHTTTTVTKTITKKKRWNANIGIGAGVGITTKKPDVYVGLNIGYSVY